MIAAGVLLPLPGYDRQGRQVTLVRSGSIRPKTMTLDQIIRANMMVTAIARRADQQVY